MSAAIPRSPGDELDMAATCLHEPREVMAISPRIAAREAYLAMLHAAHARIAATGRRVPRTHKGVNIEIGMLYTQATYGALSMLSAVEDWKLSADYDHSGAAQGVQAEEAIDIAENFVARMVADIGTNVGKAQIDAAALAALRRLGRDGD